MIKIEENRKALYQWDLNQRVVLTNVAVGTQVHFFNSRYQDLNDECLAVYAYNENGNVYANIPNILLQKNGSIFVYIYVEHENKAYTEHRAEIIVLARPKPADYVYTETEVWTVDAAIKKAIAEIKASGEFNGKDGEAGPQGPKGDKGDIGLQGPKGDPGKDAAPYTLPTASAEVKGGVKIGEGLHMDGDVLSSDVTRAVNIELIWENASPDSGFAEQVIPLDLSRAKVIFLQAQNNVTGGGYLLSYGPFPKNETCIIERNVETYVYTRKFTAADGGVHFLNSNKGANYLVPLKIWAIFE